MKEMSDEDIVKLFHSGNGEDKAFRALVAKYGGSIGISGRSLSTMMIAMMYCKIHLSRYGEV